MPAPDDFLKFAAAHARDLVRIGHAATGELAVGERLAEGALLEVFRSWPLLPAGDRLPAAHRALAVAGRQRRRLAATVPRFSGGLELRDFRAAAKEEALPTDDLDNGEVLWEALGNLSAPQRLTVALLYAGDLTVDEAARVLRRPIAAVRRTQCRALNELRLAADLEPAVVTERGGEAGGEDYLERRVREALHSHIDVPFDVAPLLHRVAERTADARQRSRRSFVLAGAAGVLVVGAVCALVWSLLGSAEPQRRDALTPPPLPPGTQLVGYGTIAAVVPADWTLAELRCGRIVADGTAYRDWATSGQCTAAGRAPSVTFADAPINFAPMSAPPERTSHVAGHVSMRSLLTRVKGVYQQTVFVFGARFMMTVRSPDLKVVDAIISSIRAVPDGFTVVPACERLPMREAVAALSDAGLIARLSFTSRLSIGPARPPGRYGDPPVTFQDRASGSVVRKGTAVALTIPSF